MKKSLALLLLLATVTLGAVPAAAGRSRASLRPSGDVSLEGAARIGERGVRTSRSTASLSSVTNDRLSHALRTGRITRAQFALRRAEAALAGEFDGHLSLVLTELALRVRNLSGVDRDRALALLARPTDQDTDTDIDHVSYRNNPVEHVCGAHFCVHWTDQGRHAVDPLDTDTDSIPDYVESVQAEMENVWRIVVDDLAFKAPKSDATSKNTVSSANAGKLDVYLVDAGSDGVYGYCTTDDPNLLDPRSDYPYFDASSYCALDEDFDPAQFRGAPADESLRVTAAHEFFHAVQLAYAAGHDTWFSEGTAAMVEDVVHDDVDDNYQYLVASPLRRPQVPLDRSTAPQHYGAWLFWRFLTELGPTPDAAPMGTEIIREVWEQAAYDGPNAPRLTSTYAAKKALANRQVSFAAAKRFFSVVNYVPEAFYEEGAAYLASMNGRRPPLMATFTLGGARTSTGPRVAELDHLTAGYVALRPGSGVTKLRVNVDLAPARTSPSASILVLWSDGQVTTETIEVNSEGVGGLRGVPFAASAVDAVIVVLDNASTRFKSCFRRATPWTCSGVPVDDDVPFELSGTAS